jgi:RNA polymerase sigma-70 factor (ECF subfamily)
MSAERETLGAAYDRYAPRLYRFLCGFLGNRDDAADAVHSTFANLLRRGLGGIEDLEAYLWTAARNEARAAVHRAAQPYLEPRNGRPPVPTERARIESALASLPEDQREVVLLHVFEGLTFREIAEFLGVPADTAASRFRYAREKLEGIL